MHDHIITEYRFISLNAIAELSSARIRREIHLERGDLIKSLDFWDIYTLHLAAARFMIQWLTPISQIILPLLA